MQKFGGNPVLYCRNLHANGAQFFNYTLYMIVAHIIRNNKTLFIRSERFIHNLKYRKHLFNRREERIQNLSR